MKEEKTYKAKRIYKAKKAYDNPQFLHSKEGRIIRMIAEYMHPKQKLEAKKVNKTIIFFGSARIKSAEYYDEQLKQLNKTLVEADLSNKENIQMKIDQFDKAKSMSHYYDEARRFSYLLSKWSKTLPKKMRYHICTGGGPGIMEAANRGAKDGGAKSIGLNISLPFEQFPNPYINKDLNFEFHYFFMRKLWFVMLAHGLIVFPGGFGTLDEMMEVLTLRQTHKTIKPLPIILYSTKYWKNVINFDFLVEQGTISPQDLKLFKFVDTPEEGFKVMKNKLIQFENDQLL